MYALKIRASASFNKSWADGIIDEIHRDYMLNDDDIEDIAQYVEDEQKARIDNQRNRFDAALRPLKMSTIRQKGSAKALYDKGLLRNSIRHRKMKDGAKVYVSGKRGEIGSMLDEGTRFIEPFNWWGYEPGTRLDKGIETLIMRKLNRRTAA